jgi:hypothetical protein
MKLKNPRLLLLAALASTLALSLGLAVREQARAAMTALRSVDSFLVSPEDPRVFFEPGSEPIASLIRASLPASIKRVETAQYAAFEVPVRIYVCATIASYAQYAGNERSGGNTTIARRIFISPKPENTPERLPFVLSHELSHLHLWQRLSVYRSTRFPTWFTEGLATLVSGGGGAEGVSEADAIDFILAGRTIDPNDTHTIFSHDSASSVGLPAHMFYKQSAMFLGYLKDRNPVGFRRLISSVENGTPFKNAFADGVGSSVDSAWREFVDSLASRGAAAGQERSFAIGE